MVYVHVFSLGSLTVSDDADSSNSVTATDSTPSGIKTLYVGEDINGNASIDLSATCNGVSNEVAKQIKVRG